MTIRIVTDSACDVPAPLVEQYNITVVPVYVNIGQHSYLDGVELTRKEFYANLAAYDPYPTTAAPAAGTFTEVYEKLAAEGATEIISLHITSKRSNTYNAARVGADAVQADVGITLFDTQQITLGGGLLVLMAAEAVAAGKSVNDVVAMLEARRSRTRVFGMLDTLNSLRRSGRVNWAEFGLGTLLKFKPILMIAEGEVTVLAKVRTYERAQQHMLRMVEEMEPFEKLAIIHANAPEAAANLKEKAGHLFPPDDEPLTAAITPAIGVHLGAGAVGFAAIGAAAAD